MSNNDELTPSIENENSNKPEIVSSPQSKVKGILQELEVLAFQKGRSGGLDVSSFNEAQTSKLLDILSKNEDNAFEFHTKRLDATREIELRKIDSSTVNQKTFRIVVIGLMLVFPIITLLIMFYKDEYFVPWLTFIAGLAGGTGLNKLSKDIFKSPEKTSLIEGE